MTYRRNKEFAVNPAERFLHMLTRNDSKSYTRALRINVAAHLVSRKRERERERERSNVSIILCCKTHKKEEDDAIQLSLRASETAHIMYHVSDEDFVVKFVYTMTAPG